MFVEYFVVIILALPFLILLPSFITVALCERDFRGPIEASLSGIISSKRPGRMTGENDCRVILEDFPPRAAIRFKVLGTDDFNILTNMEIKFSGSRHELRDIDDVIVERADLNGNIDIDANGRGDPLKFMLQYDGKSQTLAARR